MTLLEGLAEIGGIISVLTVITTIVSFIHKM